MGITHSTWWPWALIIVAGANTCAGNLLLKYSRKVASDSGLMAMLSPYFIGGVAFYGVNIILFAKALDVLPVSSAYPVMTGMSFVFLACMAALFLGESLTLSKALGMALIMAGVFLLSRGDL